MSIDIACGNCGKIMKHMIMLRSLKDTLDNHSNKCPSCGRTLSPTDFSVDIEKIE